LKYTSNPLFSGYGAKWHCVCKTIDKKVFLNGLQGGVDAGFVFVIYTKTVNI